MAKQSLSQQLDGLVEEVISGRVSLASHDAAPASADAKLAALARIAADLRDLPRQGFRARLKSDLKRRALMSNAAQAMPGKSKARPIPEGYHTVSPYLCVKGAAKAIEFYQKALGATEVMRLKMPDGRIGHAEIKIGDSRIMLADEFPEFGNRSPESIGGTPVIVHLYVEDVDALAARVSAAGVPVTVADQDYGDRSGGFTDPFGHKWNISTHKVDTTPEELMKRMMALSGQGEAQKPASKAAKPIPEGFHTATPHLTVSDGVKAIEFYKKAFGATENESMRFVDPDGRIAHAEIRIGDSPVMLGGDAPDYGRRGPDALGGTPVTIHLFVENVDALANQAVAAGAKVLMPVADQFYGDRSGKLEDPFGHVWHVSTHIEDVPPEEIERRTEVYVKQQGGEAARKEENLATGGPSAGVREGFHTITPYVTVQKAAELVDFVKQAFGATELYRGTGSAGGLHCEVRIGDSMVMIGGGGAWKGTPMPTALHLYVTDADAVYNRALQAGATSTREPVNQDYGDREASVIDPSGNHWYIATHKLTDKYIPEGLRTVTPYLHPRGAGKLIEFLKAALGAEEVARYAAPNGSIMHASVRIGDSMIEMGEAHGAIQPLPTMFYLYVSDVDALYKRAIQAGAISMSDPADQPYGDRTAVMKDPYENVWYIATHMKEVAM